MDWWRATADMLTRGGVPVAAAGAVAANAYQPPRQTRDLDLMVALDSLAAARALLLGTGWRLLGELDLYEGLEGSSWTDSQHAEHELDIIGLPDAWGHEAIVSAQTNVIGGIPTLTLPFLVITKLISARLQDTGDLARALGAVDEHARQHVRDVVDRYRRSDLADVEQLIELGKLEFGG